MKRRNCAFVTSRTREVERAHQLDLAQGLVGAPAGLAPRGAHLEAPAVEEAQLVPAGGADHGGRAAASASLSLREHAPASSGGRPGRGVTVPVGLVPVAPHLDLVGRRGEPQGLAGAAARLAVHQQLGVGRLGRRPVPRQSAALRRGANGRVSPRPSVTSASAGAWPASVARTSMLRPAGTSTSSGVSPRKAPVDGDRGARGLTRDLEPARKRLRGNEAHRGPPAPRPAMIRARSGWNPARLTSTTGAARR